MCLVVFVESSSRNYLTQITDQFIMVRCSKKFENVHTGVDPVVC